MTKSIKNYVNHYHGNKINSNLLSNHHRNQCRANHSDASRTGNRDTCSVINVNGKENTTSYLASFSRRHACHLSRVPVAQGPRLSLRRALGTTAITNFSELLM